MGWCLRPLDMMLDSIVIISQCHSAQLTPGWNYRILSGTMSYPNDDLHCLFFHGLSLSLNWARSRDLDGLTASARFARGWLAGNFIIVIFLVTCDTFTGRPCPVCQAVIDSIRMIPLQFWNQWWCLYDKSNGWVPYDNPIRNASFRLTFCLLMWKFGWEFSHSPPTCNLWQSHQSTCPLPFSIMKFWWKIFDLMYWKEREIQLMAAMHARVNTRCDGNYGLVCFWTIKKWNQFVMWT